MEIVDRVNTIDARSLLVSADVSVIVENVRDSQEVVEIICNAYKGGCDLVIFGTDSAYPGSGDVRDRVRACIGEAPQMVAYVTRDLLRLVQWLGFHDVWVDAVSGTTSKHEWYRGRWGAPSHPWEAILCRRPIAFAVGGRDGITSDALQIASHRPLRMPYGLAKNPSAAVEHLLGERECQQRGRPSRWLGRTAVLDEIFKGR